MRVHGGSPPFRGLFFDFGQRVIALRLKDQVPAYAS